ncbi:MAG: homogentisate 1,2-dioxygenase [Cyclobacteriaceae bacterium]|nr:homogentisate 1,2-dioxygenase [Cyclobacteriaceae bacterium]MCH8515227.1 homogentisate 1,2-dioxygenase [Cyclobacteriaceae bacterium]
MPFYHRLGQIPSKRHTVFKKPSGGLYYEQLFGTEGFSGLATLMYHTHRPTQVKVVEHPKDVSPKAVDAHNIKSRLVKGFEVRPTDDYLESRVPFFFNNDVVISSAAPKKSMLDYFYKNADGDEVIFVHQGSGTLKTMLGDIAFEYGDYLVIPRGMIYQMHFDGEDNRLQITESMSPVYTPRKYRNKMGQLMEHSPFCERDFKLPTQLQTHDELGDFRLYIKKRNMLHSLIYASHPFDVVGWDGYNYPYAFSIHNFEPITGRIHQPPPIHQTFEGHNFVICSFCPRLYDYHPEAVPAPYHHSNIDSDEVLYYVDGDFMSRNHIEKGNYTLHPSGIPHGPHPGAVERSIGQTETAELAVMIDTFKPLMLTRAAVQMEDAAYYQSWIDTKGNH